MCVCCPLYLTGEFKAPSSDRRKTAGDRWDGRAEKKCRPPSLSRRPTWTLQRSSTTFLSQIYNLKPIKLEYICCGNLGVMSLGICSEDIFPSLWLLILFYLIRIINFICWRELCSPCAKFPPEKETFKPVSHMVKSKLAVEQACSSATSLRNKTDPLISILGALFLQ